jgi:HK97 family phage prohead protease
MAETEHEREETETSDEKELYFFTCDVQRAKGEDGEKLYDFIATTAVRDRMGDEIPIKGWEFKAFKENPAVLWGHDHYRPLIGNVRKLEKRYVEKLKKDAIVASVAFVPEEIDPFAHHIEQLVDKGWLRAVSVGFASHKSKWIEESDDEKAERMKTEPDRAPGRTFERKELLELSLCNVPANPEALRYMQHKGLVTDAEASRHAEFFARQASLDASVRALQNTREIKAQLDSTNGMVTIAIPSGNSSATDLLYPFTISEHQTGPYTTTPWVYPVPEVDEQKATWDSKPADAEINYRLRDTSAFRDGSFIRKDLKKDKPRVVGVLGILKTDGERALHALRFPRDEGWTLTKAKAFVKDHPDLVKTLTRVMSELELNEDDEQLALAFQGLIAEQERRPDDTAADDSVPGTETANGDVERAIASTDANDHEPDVASPVAPTPVSTESKEQRFRFVMRSTTKQEPMRLRIRSTTKEA